MAESKEYVKLWLSYDDHFREYDDASVGALIRAMIAYKRDHEEPLFSGPERFVWQALKADIDAQEALSQARSEAGRKGGLANGSKLKQTEANESKVKQTEAKLSKPKQNLAKVEREKEEGAPLVPPSPSPPTPPVFSPPYDPPNPEEKERVRAKRFTPPTLAEVQSYVAERHSAVDPQEFIDFYESKGWMVGKTPMKDWKAACRNAEKWDRWARQKPKQPFVYDYGSMEGSL